MPKRSLPGTREFDRLNSAVEQILRDGRGGSRHRTATAEPLLSVADWLRDLPRPEFKESLKANLERSAFMATTAEPIAAVHTLAVPRLTFKHATPAIDFYIKAFGAQELFRFE